MSREAPKHTRIIDGIPCMTVAEHEHIVANLRREWVGFTEDEVTYFRKLGFVGAEIIEAKLKEKNT